jgi:hypothetical protein
MTDCHSTEASNCRVSKLTCRQRSCRSLRSNHLSALFCGWLLMSFLSGALPSDAQPVFPASGLPTVPGEYSTSYFSSNINVSNLLVLTTNVFEGPPGFGYITNIAQTWDLSQAQQKDESILRTDIIAATSGANYSYFSGATYAEQDTFEPSSILGWRYYGFAEGVTNAGRTYYGLDEPVAGASPEAVFIPPVIDIPSTVQFNQSWSNSVYWLTKYFGIINVSNYLSYTATVDAYGTLALPQIGQVPALRVHQVESYAISESTDPPTPLEAETDNYYYWLVPGLGVAAQVELLGNNTVYSTTLPYTNTMQRMYFANYFTNSPVGGGPGGYSGSTNLQATVVGNHVVLNWSAMTNCTNFRVDFAQTLPGAGWTAAAITTNMAWTDSIAFPSKFYRVVGNPP